MPAEPDEPTCVDSEYLVSRLGELGRADQEGSDEWTLIQEELAARRLANAEAQPTPPTLRTLILRCLTDSPGLTPSQLAGLLGRNPTVVSRVLKTLLDADIVEFEADQNDGRIRRYSALDPIDETHDSSPTPPGPNEELRQHLTLVVSGAVRARRRENAVEYACDRLSLALDQATEAGLDDVALLARRELVTSLRQAQRHDELALHLEELRLIEQGHSTVQPNLVALASACLDYEYGRQPHRDLRERLDNLTSAAIAFHRAASLNDAHDWSPREGWALLASAEIWREQTEFGVAVAHAERSAEVFRSYDDPYGGAEAKRLNGFCERLRGNFDEALRVLSEAKELATAVGSDRCLADVLLQLGDTYRCAGQLRSAADHLELAIELATSIDRKRTLGFCKTSLAAVKFEQQDLDEAWRQAQGAEPLLRGSVTGMPLNTRRSAVIARELAAESGHGPVDHSELFDVALELYLESRSPAGVAMCCVGSSGVTLSPDERSAGVLVRTASSSAGRLLIPMDPWLPTLLNQWAERTQSDDVRRVADWTFTTDRDPSFVSEMAGETRTHSALLAA